MTERAGNIEIDSLEVEESAKTEFAEANRMTTSRRLGKRGRKPSKVDAKAKLERSRQSARECRARKKLRYQYLEELVSSREKAIYTLRKELDLLRHAAVTLDKGKIPPELAQRLEMERNRGMLSDDIVIPRTKDWCQLVLDSGDESTDMPVTTGRNSSLCAVAASSDYSGKGKGSSRTSTKQMLRDNQNITNVDLSRGDLHPRSRTVSSSSTGPEEHTRNMLNQKEFGVERSGLADVTMATGSPYAIDTPSLDTSFPVGTHSELSGSVQKQTAGVAQNSSWLSDSGSRALPYSGEFPTVNAAGLFPEISTPSVSVGIQVEGVKVECDIDDLNDIDINDLLDIIHT